MTKASFGTILSMKCKAVAGATSLSAVVLALAACAMQMTPSQFLDRFPKATKARFIDQITAKELVGNGQCRVRIADRRYLSPIGMTVGDDLRGGARGVDEWVVADGANAYVVNSFDWVQAGGGATQLVLNFDTLSCQ
jgi:hypothetical protein